MGRFLKTYLKIGNFKNNLFSIIKNRRFSNIFAYLGSGQTVTTEEYYIFPRGSLRPPDGGTQKSQALKSPPVPRNHLLLPVSIQIEWGSAMTVYCDCLLFLVGAPGHHMYYCILYYVLYVLCWLLCTLRAKYISVYQKYVYTMHSTYENRAESMISYQIVYYDIINNKSKGVKFHRLFIPSSFTLCIYASLKMGKLKL